jgi:hypothetical protein
MVLNNFVRWTSALARAITSPQALNCPVETRVSPCDVIRKLDLRSRNRDEAFESR